ncbi:MAG TPA: hypothetical protein EYN07_02600 [Flavobacteriaceae bacterium]|nr:hypothetical protein [Flavobacteriaceae bacterium]HIN98109.1 hypothetical protein [Flavobacteriaceae bacterium]
MDFDWYKVLNNSGQLEQGDLIPNCPIIIPPNTIDPEAELEVDVKEIDSIVMSQSCDLVNGKIELVLVCNYKSLGDFMQDLPKEQQSKKAQGKIIDRLRKGHLPSYHLLDKNEDISINDYLVVDFRNVYGIHIDNLKAVSTALEERFRVLPPYREHLSQAFARYFMRVGLPQDIIVEGY